MPKSIAVISYHTCPLAHQEGKQTGGMNVLVLELSKSLAKLGFNLDIFTRSQGSLDPFQVNLAKNLKLFHLPAGPKKSLSKKATLKLIPQYSKNLSIFINKNNLKYDYIHSHYYQSGLIGLNLKKLFPDTPHITTFHTLALIKNLVARNKNEQSLPQRIKAEQKLANQVDQIIAPSPSESHYLQYLYQADPAKITLIPPGIDSKIFKPLSKLTAKKHIKAHKTHKIILFVGRLEPLKGLDSLVYAIKILTTKHPQAKICLWVVGADSSQDSKELAKIKNLKKLLHLPSSVKCIGQKQQKDLPFYYNAAELVVMPSHYESFGMVALESLACNTPVIITNAAGISSLVSQIKKSLITSSNHPLALAEKIETILFNPQKPKPDFRRTKTNDF